MPSVTIINEEVIKPHRSKVEILELDDDLMSNVRVAPLKRVIRTEEKLEGWPVTFFTTPKGAQWTEPDTFQLAMESSVLKEKEADTSVSEDVWRPFMTYEVDNCVLVETDQPKGGKKFQKVVNRFQVKLSSTDGITPYILFYCVPKKVKYHGSMYKRGDIISVVVKHPNYPLHWPNPPFVICQPQAEQTFIPLMAKQRLYVVTDKKNQTLDFKGNPSGTIKLVGTTDAEFDKECSVFNCNKVSSCSETMFVRQKSKKNKKTRKIVIPFTEKDSRCPILLNPLHDSVIYSQSIDGFIIRFWKDDFHPVVVDDKTPVRCVHSSETAQFFERRFEIDKRRPFFYLNRNEGAWVLS